DVAATQIIGGRSRKINIEVDKAKMAENKIDLLSIAKLMQGSNLQLQAGNLLQNDTAIAISSGNFLSSAEEVGNLIVGFQQNRPVYLRQIATVTDGPETAQQFVYFGYGAADTSLKHFNDEYAAVTISIAKKKGADAMHLSEQILKKVEHLQQDVIPDEVTVTTTRNFGETASEKVSELLLHLFVAIVVVTLFVMLAMGWRGGLVVFLSVPVTFALTLFSYYFLDYTLNRITLFALVFI
ncbi:MAG TPA: multidrug transporter AcrB, partial [Chitinophagaceae bacterium]|nr:multidrug transporter AcrB [Chitinophagaceae bacterium]